MKKRTKQIDEVIKELNLQLDKCKETITIRGLKSVEIKYITTKINSIDLFLESYDKKEFEIEFNRALTQVDKILGILINDLYTRQAIIDNWHDEKKPCCVLIQFLYRNDSLDLICFLRSSDIDRLKNDVISLAHLLEVLCQKATLRPGDIHLFITSLHRYV